MAHDLQGTKIGVIDVEIDYAIIQHFSKHLYSSPNKAVEELITNGYDALASRVDVYLPGVYGDDCLLIWDDGESMDDEGLRRLWWIARSPKEQSADRVAVSSDGKTRRLMIGKFGIGKLASYAVGSRISHICRRSNRFLAAAVNYTDAPRVEDAAEGEVAKLQTPMIELDEATAYEFVRGLFRRLPADFETMWARTAWTVAVIDELREDVTLTRGRLAWVLSTGMPLRPDFAVSVEEEQVIPKVEKGVLRTWTFEDIAVQDAIRAVWNSGTRAADVSGSVRFEQTKEGTWDAVLPSMGSVQLALRVFDRSLLKDKHEAEGRSYGFFVMVRDRLLNSDDPELFLSPPSYGTFYRMQAVINANGLDEDLLADRERLQHASPRAAELEILQVAIYRVARSFVEKKDEEDVQAERVESTLPMSSREYFRQPLSAAAYRRQKENDGEVINPSRARIEREALRDDEPLVTMRPASDELVVNTEHPLFVSVKNKIGTGRKAQEALRIVELFAVSDILLEGYLLDLGVSDELVGKVVRWRDSQLRTLAIQYERTPEEIVGELQNASYSGGATFEKALARLFQAKGFAAERDGKSGKKDVLVVAPIGKGEYSFTIEGKGSKGSINNSDADISGASAHASDVGAGFSIVVARKFAGFERGSDDGPAVLKECRTQTPPVAIVEVDALIALYRALLRNHYPLTSLVPVLQEIESPRDKLDRVQSIVSPLEHFDFRALLDLIWKLQQGTASGAPVAILQLHQFRSDRWGLESDDFQRTMFALESMAQGLIHIQSSVNGVNMLQSPDMVASRIADSLGAAN